MHTLREMVASVVVIMYNNTAAAVTNSITGSVFPVIIMQLKHSIAAYSLFFMIIFLLYSNTATITHCHVLDRCGNIAHLHQTAAGYTCSGYHASRNYAGTPFSKGTSDDCAPFASTGASVCNGNAYGHAHGSGYADGYRWLCLSLCLWPLPMAMCVFPRLATLRTTLLT